MRDFKKEVTNLKFKKKKEREILFTYISWRCIAQNEGHLNFQNISQARPSRAFCQDEEAKKEPPSSDGWW